MARVSPILLLLINVSTLICIFTPYCAFVPRNFGGGAVRKSAGRAHVPRDTDCPNYSDLNRILVDCTLPQLVALGDLIPL
jgi:hypothetical protein